MPDLLVRIVSQTEGGAEFDPVSLPGTQLAGVSWANETGSTHQIRLADGSFETQPILPDEGSRPLFVVPADATIGATIPYACAMHPDEVGSIYVSEITNMNPEDPA
jgi:hypothetical protein